MFSLEKRSLKADLIVAFQYFKGIYKHEGNQLFPRVDRDRTRGNHFKLKEGVFFYFVSFGVIILKPHDLVIRS